MAFKPLTTDHARGIDNYEMLPEEFLKWLLENFDTNKDGKITVEELREAIRASGGWFSRRKAKHAFKLADKNSNGVIDKDEIGSLVEIARKYLGLVIVED